MNVGAGQTGDTCWFFSSLNIFLTSDNGLKILWKKLMEIIPKLGPKQRAYFNSNITAPCPYKGAVKKTSAIYFWKFLNQYICAVGGPGSLIPKSGLNAYLTKNIKWRNAGTREAKGTAGAWPAQELPAILAHLGFRVGRDFRMIDWERWQYRFKKAEWTNPIMMFRSRRSLLRIPMDRDLLLEKKGYELTGAIVYVKPALNSNEEPHVWACTIRNGKGYITDSNYPLYPKECKWWIIENLKSFFRTVEPNFRTNVALVMSWDVIMYTRKEFTNKITPTCQLPIQYRPLTAANREALNDVANNYGPNAGSYLINTSEARQRFTPRVAAEVKMRYAARPVLNAVAFQNIVNEAGSFNHAMRIVSRKMRYEGFRVNQGGPNYKNFTRKLLAKFPPIPVPKSILMYLWKNSKTNTEFANRVRTYASKAGYTVNENKLKGILTRRATTRAGTKRAAERVYRLGNNWWFNSNVTNVTNKINPSNWVLDESPNKQAERNIAWLTNYNGNVKTYRRR
jgi:hypothetical protein